MNHAGATWQRHGPPSGTDARLYRVDADGFRHEDADHGPVHVYEVRPVKTLAFGKHPVHPHPTHPEGSCPDGTVNGRRPFTAHVESGEVAGLVAVVGRGTDIEVTVLGDQAVGGSPIRDDSLFRIASAGKPITAAAVLALVADGLLRLDDPVDGFLPELASPRVLRQSSGPLDDTVPAVRPITVEDLLRSTNGHGFPSDFSSPVVARLLAELHQGPPQPQVVAAPDEWMATLGDHPVAPPTRSKGSPITRRSTFSECSSLASVASRSPVTSRTGSSSARNERHRILVSTPIRRPGDTSYRHGEDGNLEVVDETDGQWASEPAFASGAGGLMSTAADLVAFQRMLLAGGGDVLPELVTAMITDH